MTPCFADSYYFFALLNPRDEAHAAVTALNRRLRRRMVTSAFVLLEVADGLAATPARPLFDRLRQRLAADRRITVVPLSDDLFERAAALFAERPDKSWSLTDCSSFIIMREQGLMDALTADHHFEQAGFKPMLRNDAR